MKKNTCIFFIFQWLEEVKKKFLLNGIKSNKKKILDKIFEKYNFQKTNEMKFSKIKFLLKTIF